MSGILRVGLVVLLLGGLVVSACSKTQLQPVDVPQEIVIANKDVPFPILVPKRLPPGHRFLDVEIHSVLGNVSQVQLMFAGPSGSPPVGGFLIDQGAGKIEVPQPPGTEVSLGSVSGHYTELNRESSVVRAIQFNTDGVWVNLVSAELPRDVLIEVAKSMLD